MEPDTPARGSEATYPIHDDVDDLRYTSARTCPGRRSHDHVRAGAGKRCRGHRSPKDEIDHLLNFVAASSCTFIRNGTEYPSDKARDHLASKYQFAGNRITTAEEFIKYLATESSMSGELYHVKCGKTEALSGVWLTNELNRYRKDSARVQAAR